MKSRPPAPDRPLPPPPAGAAPSEAAELHTRPLPAPPVAPQPAEDVQPWVSARRGGSFLAQGEFKAADADAPAAAVDTLCERLSEAVGGALAPLEEDDEVGEREEEEDEGSEDLAVALFCSAAAAGIAGSAYFRGGGAGPEPAADAPIPAANADPTALSSVRAGEREVTFKEYKPRSFAALRVAAALPTAAVRAALVDAPLRQLGGGAGKSGSLFFASACNAFLVKSVSRAEARLLESMMHDYVQHFRDQPYSLLPRFAGMFEVRVSRLRKTRFVVMNNVFLRERELPLAEKYDLKGSTANRTVRDPSSGAVLKDNNLTKDLLVGTTQKALLVAQLGEDARFLQRFNIMDYSLLVGVHYRTPEEMRRTSALTAPQRSHSLLPIPKSEAELQAVRSVAGNVEPSRPLPARRQTAMPVMAEGAPAPAPSGMSRLFGGKARAPAPAPAPAPPRARPPLRRAQSDLGRSPPPRPPRTDLAPPPRPPRTDLGGGAPPRPPRADLGESSPPPRPPRADLGESSSGAPPRPPRADLGESLAPAPAPPPPRPPRADAPPPRPPRTDLGEGGAGAGAGADDAEVSLQAFGSSVDESIFCRVLGGIGGQHDSQPTPEVYYVGIIDVLQRYTVSKRMEHNVKAVRFLGGAKVSAVKSKQYADRFVEYVSRKFV